MPQINNFTEAQAALRPLYQNAVPLHDFKNMESLLQYVGNPQEQLKIVHIAGTSGKTSTSYYCATLLRAQGLKVGLTVSPHVDTMNERLQINGLPLPEATFCKLLGKFMDLVAGSGIKPSYFELLTAMAYWEFARQKVDYAVVEVGMGGTLDATNVARRADKVCLITDIGFDHTHILGNTLGSIAGFKAGIIYEHNEVFMYRQSHEVMHVVEAAAAHKQANLHALAADAAIVVPTLPLFQQRNLGLAVQAVDYINQREGRPQLDSALIQQAAQITVPARLERFQLHGKTIIVDGSHNQQKLQTLLDSLAVLYSDQPIALLAGFVEGQDSRWQDGLVTLLPAVQRSIFTSFHSEKDFPKKSVEPTVLADFAQTNNFQNITVEPDAALAFAMLQKCPEPILLVTGSFYLLNHIRPLILKQL